MNHKKVLKVLCYLCGLKIADTVDHIPQQGFFLEPIPKDNRKFKGFTLPACYDCNNLHSREEGYVRDLYATIGGHFGNPAAIKLMPKVEKHLADKTSLPIEYQGFGRDRQIKLRQKFIEPVVIKIVKGLYFQEYELPIPSNYICKGFHVTLNEILSNINPQVLDSKILRYYDTFDRNILEVEGLSLPNDFSGFWSVRFFRSNQNLVPDTYLVMVLPPDFYADPAKYGLSPNI